MKKLILALATIGLALPAPLLAEVDPKIAEFCLKAQDFQGCVNAMTDMGDKPRTTTQEVFDSGKRRSPWF